MGVIYFKDSTVRSLCLANFDSDGDDIITLEEAASVTDIGTIFADSKITSFNEFEFFTGVISITTNAFRSSTIKSVELPSSITSIGWGAFFQCTSLSSVKVYSINPPTLAERHLNQMQVIELFMFQMNLLIYIRQQVDGLNIHHLSSR